MRSGDGDGDAGDDGGDDDARQNHSPPFIFKLQGYRRACFCSIHRLSPRSRLEGLCEHIVEVFFCRSWIEADPSDGAGVVVVERSDTKLRQLYVESLMKGGLHRPRTTVSVTNGLTPRPQC